MLELASASSLFRNDCRSVEEKLMVLAAIGFESPEALTLLEIKAVCEAVLLRPTAGSKPAGFKPTGSRPAVRPASARRAND